MNFACRYSVWFIVFLFFSLVLSLVDEHVGKLRDPLSWLLPSTLIWLLLFNPTFPKCTSLWWCIGCARTCISSHHFRWVFWDTGLESKREKSSNQAPASRTPAGRQVAPPSLGRSHHAQIEVDFLRFRRKVSVANFDWILPGFHYSLTSTKLRRALFLWRSLAERSAGLAMSPREVSFPWGN